MDEAMLISAILKGGPVAVALLAAGFSVWKWILPSVQTIYETRAKLSASEFDRAEAARKSRDEAWQAALREQGIRHETAVKEIGARHEAAVAKVVDGHDRTTDKLLALAKKE